MGSISESKAVFGMYRGLELLRREQYLLPLMDANAKKNDIFMYILYTP